MRRLLLTTSALLALVACGNSGPSGLQPAAAASAQAHRVQCEVRTGSGQEVTFAFDLPPGFVEGLIEGHHLDAPGCAWHREVEIVREGTDGSDPMDRHDSEVTVYVYEADQGLHEIEQAVEGDAVEGDEPEGDDSNLHLDYDGGVRTFGPTVGDQFRYLCFCDGQDNRHWYAQADGIRMSWGAEEPLKDSVEAQFVAALTSAGTVTSQ